MREETYRTTGPRWQLESVEKKPESSGGSGLSPAEEKKKIGEEINVKKERAMANAEKERNR